MAEMTERAVQELGALLSVKPHSKDPELAARYFEWVQGVERGHAKIRDGLATLTAENARLQAELDAMRADRDAHCDA